MIYTSQANIKHKAKNATWTGVMQFQKKMGCDGMAMLDNVSKNLWRQQIEQNFD